MLTAFAILTDGLVYAAYLFLVAVGLTLIFGVMKILNVAHGSFYTFGAYGAATAVGIYFEAGLPEVVEEAVIEKRRRFRQPLGALLVCLHLAEC